MTRYEKTYSELRPGILRSLNAFGCIGLSELDDCRLMSRYDRKFAFHVSDIPAILNHLGPGYHVLEVEGRRLMKYETLYFDTPGNNLYLAHHNGRATRYKIRTREYADTGIRFLEIKHKNNRGEVHKHRLEVTHRKIDPPLMDSFIREHAPHLRVRTLEPRVTTHFSRFTLVNFDLRERITVDVNLHFRTSQENDSLPALAMAEIKSQDRNLRSPFSSVLRELRIKETSFSKYCTGMAMLNPEVRKNGFKQQLNQLKQQQDEHFESSSGRNLPGISVYPG